MSSTRFADLTSDSISFGFNAPSVAAFFPPWKVCFPIVFDAEAEAEEEEEEEEDAAAAAEDR